MVQSVGNTLRSEIRRIIINNSIWNKEELPHQCKISYCVYEKGDRTDCNNYTGL